VVSLADSPDAAADVLAAAGTPSLDVHAAAAMTRGQELLAAAAERVRGIL
jgi:hypothetical protein